jgi:hypothetical protein
MQLSALSISLMSLKRKSGIRGSHSGNYENYHHLGYSAMYCVCEPTFEGTYHLANCYTLVSCSADLRP